MIPACCWTACRAYTFNGANRKPQRAEESNRKNMVVQMSFSEGVGRSVLIASTACVSLGCAGRRLNASPVEHEEWEILTTSSHNML